MSEICPHDMPKKACPHCDLLEHKILVIKLQARIEALMEGLKKVEWIGGYCPECKYTGPNTYGHKHDCWLTKLLSEK
jgi:hypothetical protein